MLVSTDSQKCVDVSFCLNKLHCNLIITVTLFISLQGKKKLIVKPLFPLLGYLGGKGTHIFIHCRIKAKVCNLDKVFYFTLLDMRFYCHASRLKEHGVCSE